MMREKGRVLIIEDDDAVRRMWVKNLGKAGYEVLGAATPDEGYLFACMGDADFILADWNLGGETSYHVARSIRDADAVYGRPRRRMILLSALSDQAQKNHPDLNTIFDAVYMKPVELPSVRTMVAEHFGSEYKQ